MQLLVRPFFSRNHILTIATPPTIIRPTADPNERLAAPFGHGTMLVEVAPATSLPPDMVAWTPEPVALTVLLGGIR